MSIDDFSTYVSSATRPFSDDDLLDLLRKSRENNASLGVTGMLLYKDGNFIQALEGPADVVRTLYAPINADPRHRGVIKLIEEQITESRFPEWSMAFRNLKTVDLQETPGYSSFLNEPLDSPGFQSDPTKGKRLLELFRKKM